MINWKNIIELKPTKGCRIKIVKAMEAFPSTITIGDILTVTYLQTSFKYNMGMPDLSTSNGTIYGGEYEVLE